MSYSFSTKVATVVQASIVTAALATVVVLSYVPAVAGKKAPRPQQVCCLASNPGEKAPFVVDPATMKWLRYQRLFREWKEQRGARSSITETSMMPAYQSIIGMGEEAVPLILKQLRLEGDQPDQWFWALRAITGENPVRVEDQGDFPTMAKAWIRWGEENNAG